MPCRLSPAAVGVQWLLVPLRGFPVPWTMWSFIIPTIPTGAPHPSSASAWSRTSSRITRVAGVSVTLATTLLWPAMEKCTRVVALDSRDHMLQTITARALASSSLAFYERKWQNKSQIYVVTKGDNFFTANCGLDITKEFPKSSSNISDDKISFFCRFCF